MLSTLMQDLRYSVRMLRARPGFTLIVIITLAIGIGTNTAIFSVVNAVLLKPLPYREPAKLVRVYTEFPTMNLRKFWMSPPEYIDIQKEASRGSRSAHGPSAASTSARAVRPSESPRPWQQKG
jgi:hypothetical protein